MKTTGVSNIPKFGLLGFLGHPSLHGICGGGGVSGHEMEPSFALGRHTRAHILQLVRIQNGQTNIFKHRHWVCISQDLTPDTRAHILQMVIVQNIRL